MVVLSLFKVMKITSSFWPSPGASASPSPRCFRVVSVLGYAGECGPLFCVKTSGCVVDISSCHTGWTDVTSSYYKNRSKVPARASSSSSFMSLEFSVTLVCIGMMGLGRRKIQTLFPGFASSEAHSTLL
jgi:hypothetical protein